MVSIIEGVMVEQVLIRNVDLTDTECFSTGYMKSV